MTTGPMSGVLRHLRRTALLQDGGGLSDSQLLQCFVRDRDEAAFAALVRRHGPMVLGVCRRVLHNPHDAEDAFQATWLVLARKAASIAQPELLGNWLYGAAYRAALEARSATRRKRESQVLDYPEPVAKAEEEDVSELCALLDRELSRLADKYRVPVVLCELEGRSRKEVARLLGIPAGTLSSRLATARKTLARRLAGYGLAVSATAVAAALSGETASASLPAPLAAAAVQCGMLVAAGHGAPAATGVLSPTVAKLTERVLKAMFIKKLGTLTLVALAAALLAGGTALVARPALATGAEGYHRRATPQAAPDCADQPQPTPRWKEQKVFMPQKNQGDQVFTVSVAPDGKTLAVGMGHGGALLDAATGKELASLDLNHVLASAFSPDGKILATGHLASIELWDAGTGKSMATLQEKTSNISTVAFSPDGKMLVTAEVGTARLWDLAKQKDMFRFDTKDPIGRVVYDAQFSPDGKLVATAEGPAKTVKLWDATTGKEVRTLEGHTQFAIAVAFSPDGKTLASSGGEKAVKLWDVATGKELATLEGPTAAHHGLVFSPDGKLLASAGGDKNTVRLWDVATKKELTTLTGHTEQVWTVAFSPDGKTLVSAGDDGVRLWSAEK
jgi:RNA polymerase sigma factor (sigma-70 family)